MAEFPHDTFAKDYLTELLSTIGKAVPNKVIKSERREGDLWFERNPQMSMAAQQQLLGLMGQLLRRNSLIEVFRNPATAFEIRACRGKLTDIEGELLRQAKRRGQTLTEAELPDLWFIMPTASEAIRRGFGFRRWSTAVRAASSQENRKLSAVPGVYRLPKLDRTGLIVVHQLEVTPETLWLRVLGRSGNQARAIQELVTQPARSRLYNIIEEILTSYLTNLEENRSLTLEEEELIMNLSAAYLKKQQEWKEEGRQEGRQESQREFQIQTVINGLKAGGTPEFLAQIVGLPIGEIEQLRDQV
jgi:regulator of replication initiation timing